MTSWCGSYQRWSRIFIILLPPLRRRKQPTYSATATRVSTGRHERWISHHGEHDLGLLPSNASHDFLVATHFPVHPLASCLSSEGQQSSVLLISTINPLFTAKGCYWVCQTFRGPLTFYAFLLSLFPDRLSSRQTSKQGRLLDRRTANL